MNDFYRSNYAHGMWISGEFSAVNGHWYYTGTMEQMDYFNWTLGAVTDSADKNCVKMTAEYSWTHDAGAWKTLNCDDTVAVAPYVCQIDIQGAELFDRSDRCQAILAKTPYFCTNTGTRYVAHLYCGRSCDRDNATAPCDEPQSSTYNRTSDSPTLGSGEVMTFSCPGGQYLAGGNLARACGVNGTLLGDEPVCTDTPKTMNMKTESLRRRPHAIRAFGVYVLDNDAYRIPVRGNITRWFYYCNTDGYLNIAIFRKTGNTRNRYIHVGTNTFICEAGYKREYVVPQTSQISAEAGDVIALMSPQHHTLSANPCNGASNEIMVIPFTWAVNVTILQSLTMFPNTTCMVPSFGQEGRARPTPTYFRFLAPSFCHESLIPGLDLEIQSDNFLVTM
ncbi:metalloendopeptidase [Plakobranchus ocellatus]|uniref:Metalloendopeptidase n=1 Tax=Plakobranchus ocellatus TaxID=259542 RepID=A0AAV4BXZ0_9GAST|nr:metalloendopeptidase [Plakobranchus ocellatus]